MRYKVQTVDPRFSQEYGLHYDEMLVQWQRSLSYKFPPALVANKDCE